MLYNYCLKKRIALTHSNGKDCSPAVGHTSCDDVTTPTPPYAFTCNRHPMGLDDHHVFRVKKSAAV